MVFSLLFFHPQNVRVSHVVTLVQEGMWQFLIDYLFLIFFGFRLFVSTHAYFSTLLKIIKISFLSNTFSAIYEKIKIFKKRTIQYTLWYFAFIKPV